MSFLSNKCTKEENDYINEFRRKFRVKDVTCTNCDWVGYQGDLKESLNGDVFDCHYCPDCKDDRYLKGVE